MKKLLSLVLVLVLALGSFSFATPADVVGTDYATAVDRLMSLNLLTGYPDGTFKPAATITRAEFAAVVVRSLGLETAAIKGATKFADVPATHWASGYISVASGLGIINGYTTGSFGPNDVVTYEQAVAMVVRALGYEPAVASKGGYPAGYLIVASENDLLDGVTGTVGSAAPRGLVAMLVDNAIETPLMIQIGYGDEVKYVISGTDGTTEQTLLGTKLGLTSAEKVVDSVNTDDNEISFVGDANTYKAASGLTFAANTEDLNVTVWYKSKTVYVMTIDSKVVYDYIDADNHSLTAVTLVNADKEYKVDAAAVATLDGTTTAFTNAGYDDSFAKFIFNDDNKITHVQAMDNDFTSVGLVTSATETTLKLTNTASATGATVTLVDMDDADFAFVVVDGKMASYADVKAGMFIQYYQDGDSAYYISATSAKIEGKLDSVRNDLLKITIGGTAYDLAAPARFSTDKLDNTAQITAAADLEDLDGTTVVAYKNAYNEVAIVSGDVVDTTSSFYAVLKNANIFTEQVKVEKVVDGDIELVTFKYDLATASNIQEPTVAGADLTDYQTSAYGADTDAGGPIVAATLGYEDVFEFVIDKDNVITEINNVTGITNGATTTTIDSVNDTNNSILGNNASRYFVQEDLTILNIDGGEVSTITWKEMRASDITDAQITIYLPTGDLTPDVLFVSNDALNELGTSTEDYILAYAATAPTLAGGKYSATVKTMTGDLAVVIDDSDINGWNDGKAALVLQKQSNGEYAVIDVEHGNDFVSAGALLDLDDNYTDVVAVDPAANNVTNIDGQYVTIGGVVYKVADNALVYRSTYPADSTITISDVSAMIATDTASFIHEDGVIYMMFYTR